MKKLFLILIIVLCEKSFSICTYSLSIPVLNFTVSSTNFPTIFNGTLSRGSAAASMCNNYLIGFSKGGAGTYNRKATNASTGATLNYNLFKTSTSNSNLTLIADASSSNQILSGNINRNSDSNFSYYFVLGSLNPSSLVRGGIYTDTLTVEAQSGEHDDFSPEATQPLTVNINVPKIASLSMVNTGGTYDAGSTSRTLDFGILSNGESMSFDIMVLSNAGYNLSLSSSNNQLLKRIGSSNNLDSQISYKFLANNISQNLTSSSNSPISISNGTGITPITGVRIPVTITISSVDNKAAGNYQDTITLTIATTE